MCAHMLDQTYLWFSARKVNTHLWFFIFVISDTYCVYEVRDTLLITSEVHLFTLTLPLGQFST